MLTRQLLDPTADKGGPDGSQMRARARRSWPAAAFAMVAVFLALAIGRACCAEDVRYFDRDGIRWCETRRTIQRPIVETKMQETTRTVYREQTATECRDTSRTWWTPVTETRMEAVWVGRWNPFVEPRLEYRPTTRTRWEQRTETVKVPVICRRLVPETQTVQVPVTSRRMVEDELISRVAMGPSPSVASNTTPWSLAGENRSGQAIGGMARLENDPPRAGLSTGWRASTSPRR